MEKNGRCHQILTDAKIISGIPAMQKAIAINKACGVKGNAAL